MDSLLPTEAPAPLVYMQPPAVSRSQIIRADNTIPFLLVTVEGVG